MDDRPRWPNEPHGRPGRPVPPRGPEGQPRPGQGNPPPGQGGPPPNQGGRPPQQPNRQPPRNAPGGPPQQNQPPQNQPRQNRPQQPAQPPGGQGRPGPGGNRGGPGNSAPGPEGGSGGKPSGTPGGKPPVRGQHPAPAPPEEDPWQRRGSRGSRNARVAGRTAVTLISVLVLGINGYAWGMLQSVNGGIRGNDVIGADDNQADGATDVLLVGSDSRMDAQGNPLPQDVLNQLHAGDAEGDRTDSMIVMRIPNGGGRASAMSFPRDTMLSLDRGYGEHKLTEAYSLAKTDAEKHLKSSGITDPRELEKQSRSEGQKFLIQTIDKLAGLKIDHYAEVNLLGFYNITKAVGGVDVCLKPTKSGSNLQDANSGANFKPGQQTVEGGDALAFVRQRHGLINELDRVKRQQVFMSALAKKMLQGGTLSNPSKLSSMLNSVKQTVVLDKGWDVLNFAQQMQGITGGNIEFQTAPVKMVGASGEEKVRLDPQEAANFSKNLLLPPQQRAAAEQKQKAEKAGRAKTSVNVFNTTSTSGLADKVQDQLTSQGYGKGQSSNGPPRPSSVVEYGAGDQATAQQIASTLGGIKTQQSPQAKPGSVNVYVGQDYKGPGKQSLAGPGPMRLDGMQQSKPAPLQQEPPTGDQETITADGVPCIM